MRLINRETDYAVRALAHLGDKAGERLSVSDLVRAVGVSRPFLRKILQKLEQAGILESRKGRGGGFKLARPPERIMLGEVRTVFQGPLKTENCLFGVRLCYDYKTCRLRRKMRDIEGRLARELDAITIQSLQKDL
ncbi:MAG: Rrf2 family transcriptional regulator [Elusimicrobia bacterium]|nr:Rrf2 family transcriptional regulator [Elusimicrobiota bacterium]